MPTSYQIGSGLSEDELKAANWWARNALLVRRLGYGSLIGLCVIFWGYTLWTLLDTYAISYPREQRITAIIAQDKLALASLAATAPQPIQSGRMFVFDTTSQRVNYAVRVENPNPQWYADFTWHFTAGGKTTPDRQGFLLPNDQKYLAEYGITNGARDAVLELSDVKWHRLDPSQVQKNYDDFLSQRWQLKFDDLAYHNDLDVNGKIVGQTTFSLRNPSAFGFYSIDLTVVLYRGDTPAAISSLNVTDVKPGETQPITLNWFEDPQYITKTEVIPTVNLLDPGVYIPTSQF